MLTRLNRIYHEFPRLFWVVVVVSFIDRIGGTLLFRSSRFTSLRSSTLG